MRLELFFLSCPWQGIEQKTIKKSKEGQDHPQMSLNAKAIAPQTSSRPQICKASPQSPMLPCDHRIAQFLQQQDLTLPTQVILLYLEADGKAAIAAGNSGQPMTLPDILKHLESKQQEAIAKYAPRLYALYTKWMVEYLDACYQNNKRCYTIDLCAQCMAVWKACKPCKSAISKKHVRFTFS